MNIDSELLNQIKQMVEKKRWLSPEEFDICTSTQAKYRMKKKLPYVKFGGFVKYDRKKIDELFEAHHHDVAA